MANSQEVRGPESSLRIPNWSVGDQWTVRTWLARAGLVREGGKIVDKFERKGKEVIVTCKITSVEDPGGAECYALSLECPRAETGVIRRNLVYINKTTGRVIHVIDNTLRSDGSSMHSDYEISDDPQSIYMVPSWLPLELPSWSIENGTRTITHRDKPNEETIVSQDVRSSTDSLQWEVKMRPGYQADLLRA